MPARSHIDAAERPETSGTRPAPKRSICCVDFNTLFIAYRLKEITATPERWSRDSNCQRRPRPSCRGSGAVMAQNAQNPAGSSAHMSAKVETRLPPRACRCARLPAAAECHSRREWAGGSHGRCECRCGSAPRRECTTARRMRPAEIRKIAEAEAERIGLAQDRRSRRNPGGRPVGS